MFIHAKSTLFNECNCLEHDATNRKVTGSISDELIFKLPNPSGRTRPWGLLSL
jgi:hypothetical protein